MFGIPNVFRIPLLCWCPDHVCAAAARVGSNRAPCCIPGIAYGMCHEIPSVWTSPGIVVRTRSAFCRESESDQVVDVVMVVSFCSPFLFPYGGML